MATEILPSTLKLSFKSETNNPNSKPARVLCYGAAKTRKTWWAGTAGATHQTWLLDGDGEDGAGILKNLPDSSLQNINHIPLKGTKNLANFILFITALAKERQIFWDIKDSRLVGFNKISLLADDKEYYVCDCTNLSEKDVVIIDSWTGLVHAMTISYAELRGIDLLEDDLGRTTKGGGTDKMDYYGYAQRVLDYTLELISSLPCHVILIGHAAFYENEYKKGSMTVKDSKLQVISSSGPHGAKIPSRFGDVLWFENSHKEPKTLIHAEAERYREGGCRRLSPVTHEFPSWEFKDYLAEAQVSTPNISQPSDPFITKLTGAQIKEFAGKV